MTQELVKLEKTGELARKLSLTIPLTTLTATYKKNLQKFASSAAFDGFRKGKVPEKLLVMRAGPEIRRETVNDALQQELTHALRQHNIKEYIGLKINEFDFKEAEEFTTDVHVEIEFEEYPKLEIKDFSTLKLTKYQVTLTEQDIERELLMRQRNYGISQTINRPAKVGDKVYVICVVKYKGETLTDILKEEQSILLIEPEEYTSSSKKDRDYCEYIATWQHNLLNIETNATKSFNITFPPKAEHQLAGKTAELTITVQKIEAIELHAVDSDLARLLKVPDNNVDGIKDVIKNSLENSINYSTTHLMREAICDWLVKEHDFPIPKYFIDKIGKSELTDKEANHLKLELLVTKVGKNKKLQVAKQDLINKSIAERIFSYDEQSMQYLLFLCMQDKVTDLIIGSAIIEEEPCSLRELISIQSF